MNTAIRKRVLAGVTALAFAAGGAAAAAPALAGNASYCEGAWVCVYEDDKHRKGMGWRKAGFKREDVSLKNNDKMSSWENRTSKRARWYTDVNGGGTCYNMASYSEKASLDWLTANDKMSSWDGLDKKC